jgi:hypothetical protein
MLPAYGDLRLCSVLKLPGEMFEVLDDAGPLDMEALGVAPEGDIPTHALGQRTQFGGEVASYALRRNRRQSLMRYSATGVSHQ